LDSDDEEDNDEDNDDDLEDLMDWPETNLGVFFHLVLWPVKASMYYTIPDIRVHGNEKKYFVTMALSVWWLAVFSFIMTECMENLGPLVGIDDFIMGVVFAAAGTSFPNVFASMVVARQGLGNAAISNALGGNVFNIFMGLGMPWLCYSLLGSDLTYRKDGQFVDTGLAAGGIVFPILVLLMLLVGFIFMLIATGWKLLTVHAYLAIFLYLCFLIWTFTTSLEKPSLG
jgi:Ca2+/Na+ antiporter